MLFLSGVRYGFVGVTGKRHGDGVAHSTLQSLHKVGVFWPWGEEWYTPWNTDTERIGAFLQHNPESTNKQEIDLTSAIQGIILFECQQQTPDQQPQNNKSKF